MVKKLALTVSVPSTLRTRAARPGSAAVGHAIIIRRRCGPSVVSTSGIGILPGIRRPAIDGGGIRCTAAFFPTASIPTNLVHPCAKGRARPNDAPKCIHTNCNGCNGLSMLTGCLFHLSSGSGLGMHFRVSKVSNGLAVPFASDRG